MPSHKVKQGETFLTISREHDAPLRGLLNDPENRQLMEKRKSPNILFEGDVVFVPDTPPKEVVVSTGRTWEFVLDRPQSEIKVRFCRGGAPRRGEPCVYSVDGGSDQKAQLDGEGWFRASIPIAGKRVLVKLSPGTPCEEQFELRVNHLDPVAENQGLQERLENLGLLAGAADADKLKAALEALQQLEGLPATGEPDELTLQALCKLHYS